VGLSRFELLTPRLSSVCSNQLSYRPPTSRLRRFVAAGALASLLEPRVKEPDFAFGYVGQADAASGAADKPLSRLVHRNREAAKVDSFKTR
jgi:hypothetical protein